MSAAMVRDRESEVRGQHPMTAESKLRTSDIGLGTVAL